MGKLKDSVTNWSTDNDCATVKCPQIKLQTTGDNDSVEDAIIAIQNIKTEDGKEIDLYSKSKVVWAMIDNMLLTSNSSGFFATKGKRVKDE